MKQSDHSHNAGSTDGMAQGYTRTVDVDFLIYFIRFKPHQAGIGQCLNCEGLLNFNEADLIDCNPAFLRLY